MTLKETLQSLKPNQALLHYNIATYEQFKAGIEAVEETKIPLIFGVSEGELAYLAISNTDKHGFKHGLTRINFMNYLIKELQSRGLPVFLNADHCKSVESANEAMNNLFDCVLFDGSALAVPDNILRTKEVKSRAEVLGQTQGKQILIEGEIGYLAGQSDIYAEIEINEKNFTKPEDAEKFISETKIDLLAISVGNVHGLPAVVKHMTNTDNHGLSTRIQTDSKPQIDFNLIKSIFERTQQFKFFSGLVLHGGSGLIDADFKKAIANGIKIIHLNTEFRKLWKESLMENLKEETVVPYKILNNVVNKLKEGIIYYQKLFLGI